MSLRHTILLQPGLKEAIMREIARRGILLGCVLGAVWWALEPVPGLVRAAPVDFAKEQQRDRRRLFGLDPDAELPMDQYIAHKTKDRLIRVEGEEWRSFYRQVTEASQGRSTDAQWTRRLGQGYSQEYVFFRPDESPLAAVAKGLDRDHTFSYLVVTGPGEPKYLGITYSTTRDITRNAPTWMVYPKRAYSRWLVLVGFLAYLVLPWPPRPPEAVVCSRARAVVLPDIMGLVFAALFFALPFFIIGQNSSAPGVLNFSDGWGYLTLVFWFLALSGVAMLIAAAWYAGYQVHLLPDRLRKVTLFGEEECLYAQITRVGPISWELPGWFKTLAFVVMLVNPRAGVPTRGLFGEQNQGIGIDCKDGRTVKIWMSALGEGGSRIIEALRTAGVTMRIPATEESTTA
jgi:hypothetical protein